MFFFEPSLKSNKCNLSSFVVSFTYSIQIIQFHYSVPLSIHHPIPARICFKEFLCAKRERSLIPMGENAKCFYIWYWLRWVDAEEHHCIPYKTNGERWSIFLFTLFHTIWWMNFHLEYENWEKERGWERVKEKISSNCDGKADINRRKFVYKYSGTT